MPQIPVYDGPQVKVRALQPVMQRTPDVSSGLQSLARTAQGLGELADREVGRQADLEAFGAQERILKAQNDWEFEARKVAQGEKAVGYKAQVEGWWEKVRDEEFSKLSPVARERAARGLSAAYRASVESAGNYERQQVEIGARTKLAGTMGQLQAQAIKAGPGGAGAVLQAGVETLRGYGQERGVDMTPEIVKFTSEVHLNLIDAMAQKDAGGARAYFQANRDQIAATTWDRVEKVIAAEGLNQKAKSLAASNAGKSLTEQIAAGADLEPELRDKYLTEVRNNHAMVQQAQREREQAASDQAWQIVGTGKRPPETVLMRMNGRERVQLQDYLRERAKQAAAGTPVKTDWATYIDLREKLAAGEKVDLRPYALKIAGPQMEQLLDIQTRRNDPKKAPEVASAEQQIGAYVDQMELGGTKKAEERGKFKAAAQDLFNEHLKRTGKEPTFDERQKILDQLTVEVVTKPGWLWDTKGKAFELPREQLRQQATGAARRVTTIEEARALPPGTRFIDPNGIERIR